MTNDKVHVFQANAVSQNSDVTGYPAGEKHAMLIFLRQPEEDHDWQEAENRAHSSGWNQVEFRRAGTLGESVDHLEETMRKAANSAMSDGSSIVVYADKLG